MDSVSSFFQWEGQNQGAGDEDQSTANSSTLQLSKNNKNHHHRQSSRSSSSLPFDFNFFNQNTSTHSDLGTGLGPSGSHGTGSGNGGNNTSGAGSSDAKSKNQSQQSQYQSQQNYMSQQLTDKLIEKLFAMALPPSSEISADSLEGRVQAGKLRPGLSVPIMSRNFIQLNSRLSAPFELIDNIIKFFNWDNPKLTLTILVLYTHLVLKPLPMMIGLPFFLIVIYIMVPAYTLIHQPENHSILGKSNPILAEGPKLNEVELPKPAPEISREFILNLTDLQNHMLLYVIAWDFINDSLAKFAYFIDESISSFFFLSFLSIGIGAFLFIETIWNFIPIKFILITLGYGGTIVFHPYFKDYFFNLVYSEETRYYLLNKTNKFEQILEENFGFIEPQEQREVEIYEIQRFDKSTKEWNFLFYLNNDFTKFSKPRIDKKYGNIEIIGTTSLPNVKPPKDWEFIHNGNWKIDLYPENWVSTHLLNDFVHVDNETKWVYDNNEHSDLKGEFRRRRWTRSVTRFSQIEYEKRKNSPNERSNSNSTNGNKDENDSSFAINDDPNKSPTASHFELDTSSVLSFNPPVE